MLRLNHKEIRAYVQMCLTKPTKESSDLLFSLLSEKSKHNVVKAVEYWKEQARSRANDIKAAFPAFTPMEVTVADLVVMGKTLSQICDLLDKSESNISVVRHRLRKKLALPPTADLRTALAHRLGISSSL